MPKIVIDYPEEMNAEIAILRVLSVVRLGKISEAANIPHYCWMSAFGDRSEVITRRKKTTKSADSFIVRSANA